MSRFRALLLVALVSACSSTTGEKGGPATTTSPVTAVPAISVPAAASLATTSTITQATEPPVEPAKLKSILLGSADLPAGWVAAPATETGEESTSLRPCGTPITVSGAGVASARAVLDHPSTKQRLVQQVLAFDSAAGDPGVLVAQIRRIGAGCRQSGSLAVAPLEPPAVGEAVAGLQLTGDGRVVDVAIIRSGPIDVLLILTRVDSPVDAGTVNAVVAAAGTKLAVGTGG